jgi:hypothetical protein
LGLVDGVAQFLTIDFRDHIERRHVQIIDE